MEIVEVFNELKCNKTFIYPSVIYTCFSLEPNSWVFGLWEEAGVPTNEQGDF